MVPFLLKALNILFAQLGNLLVFQLTSANRDLITINYNLFSQLLSTMQGCCTGQEPLKPEVLVQGGSKVLDTFVLSLYSMS
jgi:hypothetical protein